MVGRWRLLALALTGVLMLAAHGGPAGADAQFTVDRTFIQGDGPLASDLLTSSQLSELPGDVQAFLSGHHLGDHWRITVSRPVSLSRIGIGGPAKAAVVPTATLASRRSGNGSKYAAPVPPLDLSDSANPGHGFNFRNSGIISTCPPYGDGGQSTLDVFLDNKVFNQGPFVSQVGWTTFARTLMESCRWPDDTLLSLALATRHHDNLGDFAMTGGTQTKSCYPSEPSCYYDRENSTSPDSSPSLFSGAFRPYLTYGFSLVSFPPGPVFQFDLAAYNNTFTHSWETKVTDSSGANPGTCAYLTTDTPSMIQTFHFPSCHYGDPLP